MNDIDPNLSLSKEHTAYTGYIFELHISGNLESYEYGSLSNDVQFRAENLWVGSNDEIEASLFDLWKAGKCREIETERGKNRKLCEACFIHQYGLQR